MHERGADLEDQVAQLGVVVARRDAFPQVRELLGSLGGEPLAVLGQPVDPATVLLLGPHQALVLELLQRRVDRSGAGLPRAAAAPADLLDDLVAVHRLLGQQGQHRRSDIAPAGPRSALLPGPCDQPPPNGGPLPPPGRPPPGQPPPPNRQLPRGPRPALKPVSPKNCFSHPGRSKSVEFAAYAVIIGLLSLGIAESLVDVSRYVKDISR